MLSADHSRYQESSLQPLPLPESWTSSPATSGEANRPPYESWLKTSLCCSPLLLLHTLSDACLHTGLHESFTGTKKNCNLILCVSCKCLATARRIFRIPLRVFLIRSITVRVDVGRKEEPLESDRSTSSIAKITGQLLLTADVEMVRRTQDLLQRYFYPLRVVYH